MGDPQRTISGERVLFTTLLICLMAAPLLCQPAPPALSTPHTLTPTHPYTFTPPHTHTIPHPHPFPPSSVLLASTPSPTLPQPANPFLKFVWEEPAYGPPGPAAAEFIRELREQVGRIVGAGHLAPLWYNGGLIDSWGSTAWGNPGELVWSLAEALPYLDTSLKHRTLVYLDREIAHYPPWKTTHLRALEGARRTSYSPVFFRYTNSYLSMVTEHRPWMWPRSQEDLAADPPLAAGLSGQLENLYALYLFGRNGNRWGLLASHWSEISQIGEGIRPHSAGELAGLLAYARIARNLAHPDKATAAAERASAALQEARDWPTFTHPAGGLVQRADHSIHFPGLYNMTPEVGRFIRVYSRSSVEAALAPLAANPTWYLTREHGGFGENHLLGPDFTWAIFQSRAYILQSLDLEQTLDLPWVELGDLYYLQKLVAVIRAASPLQWKDLRQFS